MSRRHRAEKRHVAPDVRYQSPLVAHLVNIVMKQGKKNLAQRIVYGAFAKVSEKLEKGDPVDLLLGALENARPRLEVKSRREAGRACRCATPSRPRSSMPTTTRAPWSKRRKTPTRWRRPTGPLRISAGKDPLPCPLSFPLK